MKELNEKGKYSLTKEELSALRQSFEGYYTDESDCAECIRRTFENEKRLIDTHTAVALNAAERYMSDNKANSKMLVVSTASAYKFAADVLASLGKKKPESDLDAPMLLKDATEVEIPAPLLSAISKEAIHLGIIDKENMAEAVLEFALK